MVEVALKVPKCAHEPCTYHGKVVLPWYKPEIQTKFRNVTLKLLCGGGVTLP